MLNPVCSVTGGGIPGERGDTRAVLSMCSTALALVMLISATPTLAQQASNVRPLSLVGQVGLSAEAYA